MGDISNESQNVLAMLGKERACYKIMITLILLALGFVI